MIDDLNDEELLDFLMNSDYEEDLKPEDLKYLLTKFKYFYRILHSKLDIAKSEKEGELINLKDDLKSMNKKIRETKIELANKQDFINGLKNKKLSLSERFKGKLNINNK